MAAKPGGRTAADPTIAPFFEGRSLAVIGASTDPIKQGGRPVRYSQLGGYKGKVYPINPRATEVQGTPAYPSLDAVPGSVDCAFIALPAPIVVDAVRDCAKKGVKAAVIISAGFGEIGGAGQKRQDELVAIARDANMRLVGPNCMGLMDVKRRFFPTFVPLWRNEADAGPKAGGLSVVSQSGALGAHIYDMARAKGVHIGKWVTTGNQCDVSVADCIAYFADDPGTEVIMVYMEGNRDPERLIRALERARAAAKPVVVLKVGRSEVGHAATLSHTGSLAGSDAAFDGLCRQFGVYRADGIGDLMDVAAACMAGRYPARPRVGLVTISGGVGALMADAADELGVDVPALPAAVQKELLDHFPNGSARNPVDPTAQWASDMPTISHSIDLMFSKSGLDTVVVFGSNIGAMQMQLERLRDHLLPLRRKYPDKLLILSMIGPPEAIAIFEDAGIPVYAEPRRALEVVAALSRLGPIAKGSAPASKRPRVPGKLTLAPAGPLTEFAAMEVLADAGIPFPPHGAATSAAAAAKVAASVGFPAVLKVLSPDIQHKTEAGGVALGLQTRKQASEAYSAMMKRIAKAAPGAAIEGALVAHQVSGGVECILGVNRDPGLGPVVMFGMGGIFVEVYKDVAFRVAPFGHAVALGMIDEIAGAAILKGARGRPPADLGALAKALAALSVFAAANAETIESIDLNPFVVLPRGEGAVALDALILPAGG